MNTIKKIALALIATPIIAFSQSNQNKLEELLKYDHRKELQQELPEEMKLAFSYIFTKMDIKRLKENIKPTDPIYNHIEAVHNRIKSMKKNGLYKEGAIHLIEWTRYIKNKINSDEGTANKIMLCSYIKRNMEVLDLVFDLSPSTKNILEKKYDQVRSEPSEIYKDKSYTALAAKAITMKVLENEAKTQKDTIKQKMATDYQVFLNELRTEKLLTYMQNHSPLNIE